MIETARLYTLVVTLDESWRDPPQPARRYLLWKNVIRLTEIGEDYASPEVQCAPLDECTEQEKEIATKLIELHGVESYEPTAEEIGGMREWFAEKFRRPS